MNISKTQNGISVTLAVEGRLDTVTAPELEKTIGSLSDTKELCIDFAKLNYISSAGLRVLLSAHKTFSKKGNLTIINVNETVMEIFDVTGFKDILNIQ